jgi:uncharacterized protein with GYD domain
MHIIILGTLGAHSMPDHPGRTWHREKRVMLEDLLAAPEIGGQLRGLWWTAGIHDLVIHAEVRDLVAAHALSLTLSRKLKAHCVMLTALVEPDMDDVVDFLEIRDGP